MSITLRSMALAAGLALAGSAASALTITPFADPTLDVGDVSLASVDFTGKEFVDTTFTLTSGANLNGTASLSINRSSLIGPPDPVKVYYSVAGGAFSEVIFTVDGSDAGADLAFNLQAGDEVSFRVIGTSFESGAFDVVVDASVPVAPAGILLLSGLGAFGIARRKKS